MPEHKISVYFLGTDHEAGHEPNSGTPYKNDKEVYFKQNNEKTNFVFTGPTKLDIFEPNIKSISQKGENVLGEYVEKLLEPRNDVKIKIKIKGHSRGGIVAKIVYQKLKAKFGKNSQVNFDSLIVLDPYAGPFNRLAKSKDTVDDAIDVNENVVNAVYSLIERRFASPATALGAKTIIFTDCSHDKTKYIAAGITKLEPGTYYFSGTPKKLKELTDKLKSCRKLPEKNRSEGVKKIRKYVKDNIKKINNHIDCLSALKNFQKIATSRRKEIFYRRLAETDKCKYKFLVEKYLKDNRQANLAESIMKKPELNQQS